MSKNPVFQIWLINLVFQLATNLVFRLKNHFFRRWFFNQETGFFDLLAIKPAISISPPPLGKITCDMIKGINEEYVGHSDFLDIKNNYPFQMHYFYANRYNAGHQVLQIDNSFDIQNKRKITCHISLNAVIQNQYYLYVCSFDLIASYSTPVLLNF